MNNSEREEEAPLLTNEECDEVTRVSQNSSRSAEFIADGNLDDPFEWPLSFKWSIVALISSMAFMAGFSCMAVVPFARNIVDELTNNRGAGDAFSSVLPVTIWELGEAIGPLFIAPLSEIFGRYPVINISNTIFVAGALLASFSPNMPVFIACRALMGMAVSSNVLGPAVVGDMFVTDKRGTAISTITFCTILGGTVGPALGGWLSQLWGWRAVIWVCVGVATVCAFVFFIKSRETYKVAILRRKAVKLLGDKRGSPEQGTSENGSLCSSKSSDGLLSSMLRPALVLCSSGVLASLSIFGSVVFAHLYVVTVTLPAILGDLYGLSEAATGSAFVANGVGSFIGVGLCKLCLDRIYIRLRNSNGGVGLPEHRLPLTVLSGFMLPPVVVLYGLCAEFKLPLALLIVCVVWIRMCIVLSLLPMMSYAVDACGLYSASALTGIVSFRCVAAALLPVATAHMIGTLGYGWGFGVLGLVSLVLALIPVLVLRFGPRWRQRCKYTTG